MSYKETIPDEISATGQREGERLDLWQAIVESFEAEGPDGISNELSRRMRHIRQRFDTLLARLEEIL